MPPLLAAAVLRMLSAQLTAEHVHFVQLGKDPNAMTRNVTRGPAGHRISDPDTLSRYLLMVAAQNTARHLVV